MAQKLMNGCAECYRYRFGGGHADPACRRHVSEHRDRAILVMRRHHASGNLARFYGAAKRADAAFGHNQSTAKALWSAAHSLYFHVFGDYQSRRPPYRIARLLELIPCYLDSLERDHLRWKEDHGIVPLAERWPGLAAWYARQ